MTPTTTNSAAIQRYKIGYQSDEWGHRSSTPSGIPDASGSWVRYKDHAAALAGQATAARAGFQGRAERHSDQSVLVVFPSCALASEFERSLEAAPAQPAAQQQQGVAYAALAEAHGAIMGAAYDFRDAHMSGSMNEKRSAHAALDSAVRHALRASHGQAPAGATYTYRSTQATNCAGCGEHKHTPLRIDAMGGYVCLTCIDKKLGGLLGEFGYEQEESTAEPAPADSVQEDADRWRRLVNASEMAFPVAAIADDPENDAIKVYGRKRMEALIDGMDEIPNTYALAARAAQKAKP